MTAQVYDKSTVAGSLRLGAMLGNGAAWAIFGLVLGAGAQMGLPPETFYEMIGTALGVDEKWSAVYLGFGLHMLTGTVIGMIYIVVSERIHRLRNFSTASWFGTGVATGVVVWAILFVPLHFFLVQPSLQGMAADPRAERLNEMSDQILYGALAMHFIYGSMLGFLARIATSAREVEKPGVARHDAAAA
jgi:hypothetical protein